MKTVGIIPARGGSKGIPRKNLRKVGSKSLVANRIMEARKSICDEVYVSTEDNEIASEALAHVARVIHRPIDLAQDNTSTDAVLLHAIEESGFKDDDILVLLQPTSPFLGFHKINECIEELIKHSDANSAITLRLGHPFMWSKEKSLYEPRGQIGRAHV